MCRVKKIQHTQHMNLPLPRPSYLTGFYEEGDPLEVKSSAFRQEDHLAAHTSQIILGDRFVNHFLVIAPGNIIIAKFIQATE